jgi:hypothetical protein
MRIPRRQILAGFGLFTAHATQPQCCNQQQFSDIIPKTALKHSAKVVNYLTELPCSSNHTRDALSVAAAHAISELAFDHFEETGFNCVLDEQVAQLAEPTQAQKVDRSTALRKYGFRVPEDIITLISAYDVLDLAAARINGWPDLKSALLAGSQMAARALAATVYVQVTWKPPFPRIVRRPLVEDAGRLAEELHRAQNVGIFAVNLGSMVASRWRTADKAAAQMASIAGTAIVGIGASVFMMCFRARNRLVVTSNVMNRCHRG